MYEAFLIVMALTCAAAIVMGIRGVMNLRNRDDDDDAFGPRR